MALSFSKIIKIEFMNKEHLYNYNDGENKNIQTKKLPHCHFVHHKSALGLNSPH
jgi:hypothetical protein